MIPRTSSLTSTVLVVALLAPSAARADEPPVPAPSAPSDAAPPPPDASQPSAAAPHPVEPTTTAAPVVELWSSDKRATIERRAGTTGPAVPLLESGVLSATHWEHTCVAPCRVRLDPRVAYRVAGDGLVPSDSFAVPSGSDRVTVTADMGSSTGRVAGALATAGGLLAMAAGGAALVATPILESEDVGSEGFRTGVMVGGIGAASVGALASAVGIYLWLSNGSTARIEQPLAQHASR